MLPFTCVEIQVQNLSRWHAERAMPSFLAALMVGFLTLRAFRCRCLGTIKSRRCSKRRGTARNGHERWVKRVVEISVHCSGVFRTFQCCRNGLTNPRLLNWLSRYFWVLGVKSQMQTVR